MGCTPFTNKSSKMKNEQQINETNLVNNDNNINNHNSYNIQEDDNNFQSERIIVLHPLPKATTINVQKLMNPISTNIAKKNNIMFGNAGLSLFIDSNLTKNNKSQRITNTMVQLKKAVIEDCIPQQMQFLPSLINYVKNNSNKINA
jgi:hypothetical protein